MQYLTGDADALSGPLSPFGPEAHPGYLVPLKQTEIRPIDTTR